MNVMEMKNVLKKYVLDLKVMMEILTVVRMKYMYIVTGEYILPNQQVFVSDN